MHCRYLKFIIPIFFQKHKNKNVTMKLCNSSRHIFFTNEEKCPVKTAIIFKTFVRNIRSPNDDKIISKFSDLVWPLKWFNYRTRAKIRTGLFKTHAVFGRVYFRKTSKYAYFQAMLVQKKIVIFFDATPHEVSMK